MKEKKLTDCERRHRFKQALVFFGMDSPLDDRTTPVSYQNYRVVMIEVSALVDSQPEFIEAESRKLISLYVPQLIQNLFVLGDLFMAGVHQDGKEWKIVWSSELYY